MRKQQRAVTAKSRSALHADDETGYKWGNVSTDGSVPFMSQRPASEGDNDPVPGPQTPIYVVRLAESTAPNSPAATLPAGQSAASESPEYPSAATVESTVANSGDRGAEQTVEEGNGIRPVLPVSGPL